MEFGTARAVSDDGNVIVGQIRVNGALYVAGIYTPEGGVRPLSTYLASIGVTIPSNVSLLDATAVSADGRTIAGYTGLPGQVRQGFIATIPAPPAALALGILLPRRRRSRSL